MLLSRSRESWEGPSGEACEREERERVRRRRVTTGGEVATGGDVGAPSSVDADAAAAAAAWDCRACRKAYRGGGNGVKTTKLGETDSGSLLWTTARIKCIQKSKRRGGILLANG